MTSSIRTFLLINLLLSVTLITSLAIIGNLFVEHKDLQNHLDIKLTQTGYTIQAFLMQSLTHNEIGVVQKRINQIPELHHTFLNQSNRQFLSSDDYENIVFKVLDKNGNLVIQSEGAEQIPGTYPKKLGLTDDWTKDEPWRIFTTYDAHSGYTIIVAQQFDFGNVLEGRITKDSILIMLLMYPFLGLLIWIIVGRGLDSLKKVANEVHQRAPGYLEPVGIERIPIEIKPLIDELNKLFARLRQAFEREKRFAGDAAHELRTPLAALKAHTQVALKANNEEERQEALHKLLAGVDRSTHVVQQLLTLSRMLPEAGMDKTLDVDIAKQAAQVIADLVPDALEKRTELELIAPEELSLIKGDSIAISILIRNLVDNAIRYSPSNSFVQVILEETPNSVILNVIDNGPGIPEKLRSRVFERFFRVLGSQSAGSGLGLGIAQQIAELHKAKIELSTPENKQGLKVIVSFPKTSL